MDVVSYVLAKKYAKTLVAENGTGVCVVDKLPEEDMINVNHLYMCNSQLFVLREHILGREDFGVEGGTN